MDAFYCYYCNILITHDIFMAHDKSFCSYIHRRCYLNMKKKSVKTYTEYSEAVQYIYHKLGQYMGI